LRVAVSRVRNSCKSSPALFGPPDTQPSFHRPAYGETVDSLRLLLNFVLQIVIRVLSSIVTRDLMNKVLQASVGATQSTMAGVCDEFAGGVCQRAVRTGGWHIDRLPPARL